MKTKIDLSSALYKQACKEAALQNCTVEEWLAGAVERQLRNMESLRHSIKKQSKGASREKAMAALRMLEVINQDAPLEPGDEIAA